MQSAADGRRATIPLTMTNSHDRSSGSTAEASGIDVLSDMLRAVRLSGSMLFLVEACRPWVSWAPHADDFRQVVLPGSQHLVSFHIVTHGNCWAGLLGAAPTRLETGDVLVVAHEDAYFLADPADATPTYGHGEAVAFFRDMVSGKLPSTICEGGNGGGTSNFICGFLGCDARPFNPLLSALPPLVRVPAAGGGTASSELIAFALRELRSLRSGGLAVRLRLAELLFVEVMRRHIEALPADQLGWLAAARNPLLARCLAALHGAPARAWTLEELAKLSGASRSVLAGQFSHCLGQPPMLYLRHLRMQLACRLLAEDDAKICAVANSVGFASEAAFSRAFKKCVGHSPDHWRRLHLLDRPTT